MTYVRTALIAATVALFACGGAAAAPGPNATAAATIATAAASAAATGTATSATKASANNATYPVDDPSFAKLKSQLAKYNPSADTLSRILAALSLP